MSVVTDRSTAEGFDRPAGAPWYVLAAAAGGVAAFFLGAVLVFLFEPLTSTAGAALLVLGGAGLFAGVAYAVVAAFL